MRALLTAIALVISCGGAPAGNPIKVCTADSDCPGQVCVTDAQSNRVPPGKICADKK